MTAVLGPTNQLLLFQTSFFLFERNNCSSVGTDFVDGSSQADLCEQALALLSRVMGWTVLGLQTDWDMNEIMTCYVTWCDLFFFPHTLPNRYVLSGRCLKEVRVDAKEKVINILFVQCSAYCPHNLALSLPKVRFPLCNCQCCFKTCCNFTSQMKATVTSRDVPVPQLRPWDRDVLPLLGLYSLSQPSELLASVYTDHTEPVSW